MVARVVKFLIEAQGELKKVVWPTQKEIVNLTIVVLAVSLAVGLFLTGADFVFSWLIKLIIDY